MFSDVQIQKITAALQPFYADPDFANLTGDFVVTSSLTPPVPQPETVTLDVPRS